MRALANGLRFSRRPVFDQSPLGEVFPGRSTAALPIDKELPVRTHSDLGDHANLAVMSKIILVRLNLCFDHASSFSRCLVGPRRDFQLTRQGKSHQSTISPPPLPLCLPLHGVRCKNFVVVALINHASTRADASLLFDQQHVTKQIRLHLHQIKPRHVSDEIDAAKMQGGHAASLEIVLTLTP